MEDWRKGVDTLYHLLDQEVSNYRQLIDEVKEEARCLRSGDTDSLILSVRAIEDRIEKIRMNEEEVRRKVQALLQEIGKGEGDPPLSSLLSFLPPAHRSRLSSYQRTLDHLKTWVKQINDQNTQYIRDCLDILSSLLRPLLGGEEPPTLYPKYRSLRVTSPCALSQEV